MSTMSMSSSSSVPAIAMEGGEADERGGEAEEVSSSSSSLPPSPDFEFRPLPGNFGPLPSAAELFSHGFLLPLDHKDHRPAAPDTPSPPPPPPPTQPVAAASKRWKGLLLLFPRKPPDDAPRRSPAELNIHLWPFPRSRSAGNPHRAPAPPASLRKAASAPCSRSNSRGHRWAGSPARPPGIPVGRASPVWRRGSRRPRPTSAPATDGGGGAGTATLGLTVNACIGYGRPGRCGGEREEALTAGDRTSYYSRWRSLFSSSKKVC